MMDEKAYRALIQQLFDRIQLAFDDVDPDVAECEVQFGALTIRLASGARCILSAQPSVRQLWMALASRGIAHHFNWDAGASRWIDDKGQGLEVVAFLKEYLKADAGLQLPL